jgi:tetraacyldisaccharide 4'-kinase
VQVRSWLSGLWYGERAGAAALQPLACCYRGLLSARRRAYAAGWLRSGRAGRPVVVVGNLTVGGTGKTPLTIWLARALSELGLAVGIVSRGYGSDNGPQPRTVGTGSSWEEVGDEPLILARRSGCPTVVATDRLAAARALAGVDLIIADDGLQHLRLMRDCEIVVIDGARGFGNGRLLPAGPLREPVSRLGHADVVVVNGAPEHRSLAQLPAGALRMHLRPQHAQRLDSRLPPQPLATFAGQRVHAVAAIGNPQRFFAELRAQGLEIIEHAFADHHPLAVADLAFGDQLPVLMTEKDAVKCPTRADMRLWYVPVVAEFAVEDARRLLECVLGRIRAAMAGGR